MKQILIGVFAGILSAICVMGGFAAAPEDGWINGEERYVNMVSSASDSADAAMFAVKQVDGGLSVTGFSSAYLNSLTAEEKQSLAIVIPAVYNGTPVVAIADDAFRSTSAANTGCKFVALDLSNASNLKTIGKMAFYSAVLAPASVELILPDGLEQIGNNAFYNCTGLTGDLILPDSIQKIEASGFFGCSGLNGRLRLPENPQFTTIASQMFYKCNFTGELSLPDSITVIENSAFRENKFIGALTLPSAVTSIGNAAFSGCSGFTGRLNIPDGITSIASQTFQNCTGFTGALYLPANVVTLASQAFGYTNFETVYLPAAQTLTFTGSNSPFYGSSRLKAVVCASKESYTAVSAVYPSDSTKNLLGYPVSVTYEGREDLPPLTRLYGRPVNYVREEATGIWAADSTFELPDLSGETEPGYVKSWNFQPDGKTGITNTSLVAGPVLYQISRYADPVIVTPTVDTFQKVYDGEELMLNIEASQPLQGTKVALYYAWYKVTNYQGTLVQWDENASSYPTKNVSDSAYNSDGSSFYTVKVYAYDTETMKPYYSSPDYYFYVSITPRPSAVTPVCRGGFLAAHSSLPPLALSDGDTAGVIFWDNDQQVEAGEKEYGWTFTPNDPNYAALSGAITLTAEERTCYIKGYDRGEQSVTVVMDEAKTGSLILAEYDGDGILLSATIKEGLDFNSGETVVAVPEFQPKASSTCRVMAWSEMNQLMPLCEGKEV